MSKTNVIISIFVVLVLIYFVYLVSKVVAKQEKFTDDPDNEEDVKQESSKSKSDGKKETYADKELDMNLFIINTFENVHGRKIKTEEFKQFTEIFQEEDLSKKEMKNKIESYKKERFEDTNDNTWDELLQTSKKLTSIIEKMSNKNVETFKNNPMPFFDEKKYMTLR